MVDAISIFVTQVVNHIASKLVSTGTEVPSKKRTLLANLLLLSNNLIDLKEKAIKAVELFEKYASKGEIITTTFSSACLIETGHAFVKFSEQSQKLNFPLRIFQDSLFI